MFSETIFFWKRRLCLFGVLWDFFVEDFVRSLYLFNIKHLPYFQFVLKLMFQSSITSTLVSLIWFRFGLSAMNLLLSLIVFDLIRITDQSNYLVHVNTIQLNWTSVTFLIPLDPGLDFSQKRRILSKEPYFQDPCLPYSKYYCLVAYEILLQADTVAFMIINALNGAFFEIELYEKTETLHNSAVEICEQKLAPIHRRHNLFYNAGSDCCRMQCMAYRTYGFSRMLLSPTEYISKMVDYSEQNKRLNFIQAYYHPDCRVNVITKIGFGTGGLVRQNHPYIYSPYMPEIDYYFGNNDLSTSRKIPFGNPGQLITFEWFKQNMMCRDQSWICGRTNN